MKCKGAFCPAAQPEHPLPAVVVLGSGLMGSCGALGKGLCRALEQSTSPPRSLPLLTTPLLLLLLLKHMRPLWGINPAWGSLGGLSPGPEAACTLLWAQALLAVPVRDPVLLWFQCRTNRRSCGWIPAQGPSGGRRCPPARGRSSDTRYQGTAGCPWSPSPRQAPLCLELCAGSLGESGEGKAVMAPSSQPVQLSVWP